MGLYLTYENNIWVNNTYVYIHITFSEGGYSIIPDARMRYIMFFSAIQKSKISFTKLTYE